MLSSILTSPALPASGRVLAVVVTKAGAVLDRVLTLDRDLSHTELNTAANFLNENFRGWSMEEIRRELERRIEQERHEYDQLIHSVGELCRKGALDGEGPSIFVEGVGNLIASQVDRDRLRQLLARWRQAAADRAAQCVCRCPAAECSRGGWIGRDDSRDAQYGFNRSSRAGGSGESRHGGRPRAGAPADQETMNAVSFIAQLSERILQPPQ